MLQRRAKDAKLTRERLCWLGTMATKLNRNDVFKNYLGCFQVRLGWPQDVFPSDLLGVKW